MQKNTKLNELKLLPLDYSYVLPVFNTAIENLNNIEYVNNNIKNLSNFLTKPWIIGFIEAEGCFSIRKSNNHSFSIGQNDDIYLINAIKEYFQVTNKIRNPYGKFYFLEVYKKEVLFKIISHCTNYPLLGEKLESLNRLKSKL